MKKVRIRKFNFKKFFKFIFILIVLTVIIYFLSKIKIKNIVIKGNTYMSDLEIIETAKLDNYPSYFKTLNYSIEKRIKNKYPLIDEVKVKKGFGFKVTIEIEEKQILYMLRSTNEYILTDNTKLTDIIVNKSIPILINYVPDDIEKELNNKLSLVNSEILEKISEIEYSDNKFIFYMNDGNIVYITLSEIKKFNNYNKIKEVLGKHKGILYLDRGNYFEIKE